MRNWKQKLPALVLSAALLASFAPAWPGGRDVPDRKSNGSSSSEDYVLPIDGEGRGVAIGFVPRLRLPLAMI